MSNDKGSVNLKSIADLNDGIYVDEELGQQLESVPSDDVRAFLESICEFVGMASALCDMTDHAASEKIDALHLAWHESQADGPDLTATFKHLASVAQISKDTRSEAMDKVVAQFGPQPGNLSRRNKKPTIH